jgi:hypothetical protein
MSKNSWAAAQGERAYRPLVERLAADAIASIDAGGIQLAGDYQLPEVDRRALAARREEEGFRAHEPDVPVRRRRVDQRLHRP